MDLIYFFTTVCRTSSIFSLVELCTIVLNKAINLSAPTVLGGLGIIVAGYIGWEQNKISRRQVEFNLRQAKLDYVRFKIDQANILYARALEKDTEDKEECKQLVIDKLDEYFKAVEAYYFKSTIKGS